jgi:RNA polymerase sigma-70 factor (ECF subfamily)
MAESDAGLTSAEADCRQNELLLLQAAKRDPKAFGEVYRLYVEHIFRYLFGRLGSVPEAEDATAQTFLAAFESFGKFRQDGHFASWLFAIARHKAMDHYRQRKNTIPIEEIRDLPEAADPLPGIIRSQQAAALRELIQALPEEDRELLRLRFLAAMSFPEIARLLGRNEDAVKKAAYRLLARLHGQLEVSNE